MTRKLDFLFPIEISNRELPYRLYLAGLVARKDRRVLVGQQDILYSLARQLRGGVYLGQNIRRGGKTQSGDLSRYEGLKERGFRVIFLDEEGGIFKGPQDGWGEILTRRFDPSPLEAEDWMTTWGAFQRDVYAELEPRCAEHLVVTGHPRFDLYKPVLRDLFADDVVALRRRLGRYVLVNTSFTMANNLRGAADVFTPRQGYWVDDVHRRLEHVAQWAHVNRALTAFVQLVHRLAVEVPEVSFVVRPHPTESKSFYEAVFRGVPRVLVLHDGPVAPWLLGCEAIIHDGCTTGVEAFIAGAKIINFKSVPNGTHDAVLPNLFGRRTEREDDVVESVREAISGAAFGPPPAEATRLASSMVANLDPDKAAGFNHVVRVLDAASQGLRPSTTELAELRLRRIELLRRGVTAAKAVVRPAFPERRKRFAESRGKFGGLRRARTVEFLRRVARSQGRDLRWSFLSDDVVSIEAE